MSDINQPPAGEAGQQPDVLAPMEPQSPHRPEAAAPPPPPPPVRRKSGWKKVLLVLILVGGGGLVVLFIIASVISAMVGLAGGGELVPSVYRSGEGDQVVAVLEVNGMIDGGKAALVDRFRRAVEKDKKVKAILLRVDSPGGVVAPCDEIYHMLKGLQAGRGSPEGRGKKLVVSMGSMATSGGYYISAPADEIYAEPTTVTGSIGVLGSVFVVKGTMEKIGVDVKIVRSTQAKDWKAAPNAFEEPTPAQMAEFQKIIDLLHDRFQGIVEAERGRKIKAVSRTVDAVDAEGMSLTGVEPYNGKVYLADAAKQIGLIDGIGYLDDAVDAAARLAGLSKPKVVIYRQRRSPLAELRRLETPAISPKLLEEIQVPKLMMVWKVGG